MAEMCVFFFTFYFSPFQRLNFLTSACVKSLFFYLSPEVQSPPLLRLQLHSFPLNKLSSVVPVPTVQDRDPPGGGANKPLTCTGFSIRVERVSGQAEAVEGAWRTLADVLAAVLRLLAQVRTWRDR